MPYNIEIKAKCKNPDKIKNILKELNADFKGIDHQIDTYFKVPKGRMKLREGNIEQSLIFYQRTNQAGPKGSEVDLHKPNQDGNLKPLLANALGILAVVDKHRGIYFVDNVKFHVDKVNGLGDFVEIEAIDKDGSIGEAALLSQCRHYMELFEIEKEDLLEGSYSDMIMAIS